MKATTNPYRRLSSVCLMFLCIVSAWNLGQANAEAVDSELVLLVDATSAALNNNEFSTLMDAYAATFSSADILNSIQSGATGRIAVSLMFYGNTSSQEVGIPWMMIENSAQALQFANSLLNVTRPSWGSTSDIGTALLAATSTFGRETGSIANGFESAVQIIEVAASKKPQTNDAQAAMAGSASALAAGVDIINSLALGNQSTAIDEFYTANVIGSTIPGVPASNSTAPLDNALASTMGSMLNQSLQTGAAQSIDAVPEPGRTLPLVTGIIFLLKRRRR